MKKLLILSVLSAATVFCFGKAQSPAKAKKAVSKEAVTQKCSPASGTKATAASTDEDDDEDFDRASAISNYVMRVVSVASTNLPAAQRMVDRDDWKYAVARDPQYRALAAYIDPMMAEKGICLPYHLVSVPGNQMPLCTSNGLVQTGMMARNPGLIAVASTYGIRAFPASVYSHPSLKFEDCLTLISDMSRTNSATANMRYFSQLKQTTQARAEKVVKRYLRSNGQSFVVKNGVNPCEVYLRELNVALNAGYLAGLNDWAERMGLQERVSLSLPSAEKAASLKEKVLFGEVALSERVKFVLAACLGTAGYNEFVKEYNGENR